MRGYCNSKKNICFFIHSNSNDEMVLTMIIMITKATIILFTMIIPKEIIISLRVNPLIFEIKVIIMMMMIS